MSEPSGAQQLRDTVAIVTGAGGDIGRAICVRYAREGARVLAADLRPELAERTAAAVRAVGGEGVSLAVDVSHTPGAEALARAAVERWDRAPSPARVRAAGLSQRERRRGGAARPLPLPLGEGGGEGRRAATHSP